MDGAGVVAARAEGGVGWAGRGVAREVEDG